MTLGLLQALAGRFSLLCHLTGQHATSLTANLRRGRDVKSLLILDHNSIFLDSYNECASASTINSKSIIINHRSRLCNDMSLFLFLKILQLFGQLPGDGGVPGVDQALAVSPHILVSEC